MVGLRTLCFRLLVILLAAIVPAGIIGLAQTPASPPSPGQQNPPKPQAPPAQQQQASEPADSERIVVRVERVNIPFTVVDGKDRFVTDLTKEDFAVFEDGKRVDVDFFTPMTSLPLRVGLLMDTSNSVRLMFKGEQEAAIDFVHNLLPARSKHRVFLMTFDSTKDIVKDFTNDPDMLSEAIRKMKVGGGTTLFDAIVMACKDRLQKQVEPGGIRRVLVLISDGEDVASKASIEQVIDIARRAEVSLYAISLNQYGTASPGDNVLEKLAEETGGAVVYPWRKPPSAEFGTGYLSRTQIGNQNAVYEVGLGKYAGEIAANLALALLQINHELTNQYTIGYRPPNPVADGRFREVKVETRVGGAKVRARKGYYSAPPG